MDVYVDSEILSDGINSIDAIIQNIADCVSMMKTCLIQAGENFDTINYDRASNSVNGAFEAVDQMSLNLEQARVYLQKLSSHIEKYNSLKY